MCPVQGLDDLGANWQQWPIARLRFFCGSFINRPSSRVQTCNHFPSGAPGVTEDLDPRRKRIIWRATHRGIREMDFVVGTFVKQRIAASDEAELAELERILEIPDQDLMAWMTGALPVPAEQTSSLLEEMLATRFDETFFGNA
jgi:antitoxin CptB